MFLFMFLPVGLVLVVKFRIHNVFCNHFFSRVENLCNVLVILIKFLEICCFRHLT